MPLQYDANGIITQNLPEILEERENALRPIMGEDFIIDKTTPIGNMELADANNELAIQELVAYLIPNMLDANTAQGIFLDAICEKNRIYRKQPEHTIINLYINGKPDTSLNKGDVTVVDSVSGIYYTLNEDITINSSGKMWAHFKCDVYGEYAPSENSKFEILTPVNGLNNIERSVLVKLGRLTETDEELRTRRFNSVQQTSTTTIGSIKSVIYSLDGVKFVTYFENDTESTDENGLPMKSFEFVVDGGDSKEITDAIFVNKTIGTRAYGTTNETKKDSEGNYYTIGYTKAEQINIVMEIHLTVDSSQSNLWKQQVCEALKSKFDSIQGIGTIVKDYNYFTVLANFPEITDIASIQFYEFGTAGKKQSQYPIGKKQIAKLSIDNIRIIAGVE